MIRFSQIFKKESPSGMKNGDYLKYAIGEIVLVVLWNINCIEYQ